MTAWDVNVSHAASVKVFYWKCEILNNAWSKAGLPWVIWHLRPMEKQHSERNRNNTICLLLCCSSGLQWIWYRERYIQLERSTKQVLYLIPVGKKVCRVVAESLFTFSSIWLDKLNILHTVFFFSSQNGTEYCGNAPLKSFYSVVFCMDGCIFEVVLQKYCFNTAFKTLELCCTLSVLSKQSECNLLS